VITYLRDNQGSYFCPFILFIYGQKYHQRSKTTRNLSFVVTGSVQRRSQFCQSSTSAARLCLPSNPCKHVKLFDEHFALRSFCKQAATTDIYRDFALLSSHANVKALAENVLPHAYCKCTNGPEKNSPMSHSLVHKRMH